MLNRTNLKRLAASLTASLALVLSACGNTTPGGAEPVVTQTGAEQSGDLELTVEELAEFNGQDGQPAYVAVDGVIYEVSDSDLWTNGEHNGFEAGQDLTEAIDDVSPHGRDVLDRMPVVGRLVD